VDGISGQAKADLLARLPVHVGDTLTEDVMVNVQMAIQDVRLGVEVKPDNDGVAMRIGPQSQFGYEEAGGASSYRQYGNITVDQLMVDNSDLYTSSTSVLKSIAVTGISDSAESRPADASAGARRRYVACEDFGRDGQSRGGCRQVRSASARRNQHTQRHRHGADLTG